jgi:hypothetical protein
MMKEEKARSLSRDGEPRAERTDVRSEARGEPVADAAPVADATPAS